MSARKACRAMLAFITFAFLCTYSDGLLVEPTSTKGTSLSSQAPIVIHPPPNHTPYQLLLTSACAAGTWWQQHHPCLTVEAGGLKGVMQAYILQQVRDSIKEAMVDHGYVPDSVVNATDFDIDLADWFPTIAGTSIGAVQALYYASRGGSALARSLVEVWGLVDGLYLLGCGVNCHHFGLWGTLSSFYCFPMSAQPSAVVLVGD